MVKSSIHESFHQCSLGMYRCRFPNRYLRLLEASRSSTSSINLIILDDNGGTTIIVPQVLSALLCEREAQRVSTHSRPAPCAKCAAALQKYSLGDRRTVCAEHGFTSLRRPACSVSSGCVSAVPVWRPPPPLAFPAAFPIQTTTCASPSVPSRELHDRPCFSLDCSSPPRSRTPPARACCTCIRFRCGATSYTTDWP